jgi:hypothetical protein
MKKIIEQVEGEGLDGLLGENVILMCANYFYHGKLAGVNDTCVLLEGARIVYDTGEWAAKDWATAESLPGPWYVQTAFIESYGRAK